MTAMPEEAEGRFRSHNHYIEAFAWIGGKTLLTRNSNALAEVAARAAAAGVLVDRAPTSIDHSQVHRSLRNAWSTEILLSLPGEWAKDEDEFMRLSNTWGVVQAYYVGYHVTQALIVAKGSARPTTHPATQQQFATSWVDRPIDLAPWSFGIGASGWRNLPPSATVDLTVHPWSNCSQGNCWSLAGKALNSTRDDVVKAAISTKRDAGQRERKRNWEREQADRLATGRRPRARPTFPRPQLSAQEKAECNRKVRTYTLLDYLYRLRIGANYDDSAVFTDGPENEHDSFLLHKRLTFLASGLSLISELRVRDLVGSARFHKWATPSSLRISLPVIRLA